MQGKFGLKEEQFRQIQAVFEQFPEIETVLLYGSRAKGNFRPGSDIDITLIGKGLNLGLLNKLSEQLDDLLLPYMFDISIYQQIKNPNMKAHIESVGKDFYKKGDIPL